MSMLERIREQPKHVREIMFGFSVVIAVSLVGTLWFRDFRTDIYALMNPEEVSQEKFFVQNSGENQSLFSSLGETMGDISSVLTGFWGSDDSAGETGTRIENRPADKVYLFPLSEER